MTLQCSGAFVTLSAPEFDKMVQFYRKILSQQPNPHSPGRYAEFALPGLKLGIFRPKATHASGPSHSASAGMSLCLEVDNLEAAIAHFTRLGYPPPGSIKVASHGQEIDAYDPDGNRIILHQSN